MAKREEGRETRLYLNEPKGVFSVTLPAHNNGVNVNGTALARRLPEAIGHVNGVSLIL